MKTITSLIILMTLTPFLHASVVPPVPRGIDWQKLVDANAKSDTPTENEDPAKTVERITQTADTVSDKLKEKDTTEDTRKKQDQLLADIDKLLKQNSPPPPPMPMPMSGGQDMNPEMNMNKPQPQGSGSGMKPSGSSSGGSSSQRPMRTGSRGSEPQPMGSTPKPMPMGTASGQPMGTQPATGQVGERPGGTPPALPLENPFAKQVWGHLPERLREQASQYYREQYMPKYQEMLKMYYSKLAEQKPSK